MVSSRLEEEAGRLRGWDDGGDDDDDDEANDEVTIVEARRRGAIRAPLRTSALARKLLPGPPGGGGMVSFATWLEFDESP